MKTSTHRPHQHQDNKSEEIFERSAKLRERSKTSYEKLLELRKLTLKVLDQTNRLH